MIKRPALYGLNRKKRRQLDHLSVGQKRQAMSDLRHDLALLTIRRSDPILDANLIRWDDYIDGGRVDGIANALREMMAFVDQCHAEYKAADLEDSSAANDMDLHVLRSPVSVDCDAPKQPRLRRVREEDEMNQQEAIEAAKKLGFEWVAMDKNKWWSAYSIKPNKDKTLWGGALNSSFYSYLGKDTSGINWEESLEEVK